MSNRDIQLESNSKIMKMLWVILLACIGVLLISVFFIRENYRNSNTHLAFVKLIENQELKIESLSENGFLVIDDNGSSQYSVDLLLTGMEDIKRIKNHLLISDYLSNIDGKSVETNVGDMQKIHGSYLGIIELIVNNDKGVLDNREVVESQLLSQTKLYINELRLIRNWSLDRTAEFNLSMYKLLGISNIVYLMLLISAYFFIITPLKNNFEQVQIVLTKWNLKVEKSENAMNVAIGKEKESSLLLKTKIAQVIKLQESLKVAIQTANQVKQDKNLVYFNAATDLGDYLKVLNRQKEILENQTNIAQQIGWNTLTSTIAQLNAMVGDYFNQSKLGITNKYQKEVYLSQLISEILISSSSNDLLVFEQVADMPTVKTDVELLKRVLLPYFELISRVEVSGKIRISVIEDGSSCEIKFMGLTNAFKESLVKIESKELADLDFDEYKIHMSKNTIEERGGKQWIQAMKKHNGVFIISWVL
jgi:hypothetical protein